MLECQALDLVTDLGRSPTQTYRLIGAGQSLKRGEVRPVSGDKPSVCAASASATMFGFDNRYRGAG